MRWLDLVLTTGLIIYLQGSYANSTNIKEDSDVDIVVECNSIFLSDTSALSETNKKYVLDSVV